MKKKYLSILLLGTLLLHFGTGKAENSDQKLDSIFEIQDYVEQTLNVKSSTISSRNHFPLIKEILEKKCPSESIDEAKSTLENLNIANPNRKPYRILQKKIHQLYLPRNDEKSESFSLPK